jgi:hypothetical protein
VSVTSFSVVVEVVSLPFWSLLDSYSFAEFEVVALAMYEFPAPSVGDFSGFWLVSLFQKASFAHLNRPCSKALGVIYAEKDKLHPTIFPY